MNRIGLQRIVAFTTVPLAGLCAGIWFAHVQSENESYPIMTVLPTFRPVSTLPPASNIAAAPAPPPAVVPTSERTARPTVVPAIARTPAPALAPTAIPTATPPRRTTPSPAITPAPAPHTAAAALPGAWRVQEANVLVGTIVWSGNVRVKEGDTAVLDVRKEKVAGASANRCERNTALRAEFTPGLSKQTVPYREVNCEGVTTSGELRIASMSPEENAFSGTVWREGAKLGTFNAYKR
jgi:hypothetical protein